MSFDVPILPKSPKHPVFLIVGCARSGSTLLMQLLAATNAFSYPSNVVSRFYTNPYVGLLVEKILRDKELVDGQQTDAFKSNLGKTKGLFSPAEFWYFWRAYFKFGEVNKLSAEALSSVDKEEFLRKLSAFELVSGKPLLMKGMIMNWNLDYLYEINPNFIFIHLKRDPIANAKSLLDARQNFFGSKEMWYSFKPPEYDQLKRLSVVDQVVGQVIYTNRAIEKSLSQLPKSNTISLTYEDVCENQHSMLDQLRDKGIDIPDGFRYEFQPSKQSLTASEKWILSVL